MPVWSLCARYDKRQGLTNLAVGRQERHDGNRSTVYPVLAPRRLLPPAPRNRQGNRKLSPSRTKSAAKPKDTTEPSLLSFILTSLDDNKALDIVTIDFAGRSSLCDAIVVATGTSQRHVASTAEHLARKLKEEGFGAAKIEGLPQGDWVLVDAGDVIVHLFRPEVRAYYDLEGMWSVDETAPDKGEAASAPAH